MVPPLAEVGAVEAVEEEAVLLMEAKEDCLAGEEVVHRARADCRAGEVVDRLASLKADQEVAAREVVLDSAQETSCLPVACLDGIACC